MSTNKKWFKPSFLLTNSQNRFKKAKIDLIYEHNDPPVFNTRSDDGNSICNRDDYFKLIEPKNIDDLCINTRKIEEVKQWLQNNCGIQNRGKFLLITGPVGSGKTTTIHILCKHLNITLKEWINPMTFDSDSFEFNTGITDRFLEFMKQSTRCKSFDLYETNNRAVILVDDFPNSILNNPSIFETILKKCHKSSKLSIIFTCTEDSTNLMNILFNQNIRDTFQMELINFNPVSTLYIQKALRRITTILSKQNKRKPQFQLPVANLITSIANSSMGDLRNAILNYYLASIRNVSQITYRKLGNFDENEDYVKPAIKDKKIQNSLSKSKSTENELVLIKMNKDTNLDIFHALGRVLYAKRDVKSNTLKFDQIEQIVNEFSNQSEIFISALFHNYLNHFGEFDDVVRASGNLSFANNLISNTNFNEEFSLQLYMFTACLGLMIENKAVIKKWNPIRFGKTSEERKISYIPYNQRSLLIYDKIYYDIINNINK